MAVDVGDARELLATNYSRLEFFGYGELGVVFNGLQRTTGAPRAIQVIKVTHKELDDAAVLGRGSKRMRGDALVVGLRHPYIAAVYDVSVLDMQEKLVAIVKEVMAGQQLTKHLLRERRRRHKDSDTSNALLTSGLVARVMMCMLSALEYCAQRGIVHHAVQPNNIMLQSEDGAPCKLIEFGHAGLSGENAWQPAGSDSVSYVAPEKLRGEAPSALSDVYSLGMVVYEMIMLRLPETDPLGEARQSEPVAVPTSVPLAYRRLVGDMLQSHPSNRPTAEMVSGKFQLTGEFRAHCRRRIEVRSGVDAMERLVANEYDEVQYLGGGAFGHVFKGWHRLMGGVWAVKVGKAVAHVGERLLVNVRHEHIAHVQHIARIDGFVCVQMELAQGAPLAAVMDECKLAVMDGVANRLTESGAAWWMMEAIVRALVCLEEHGIIHEDIKPENIVVDEPHQGLKVIDFGLAVSVGEMVGEQGGTRLYCAPEKLRGEAHDCCADVYSAGAVMWEMVMLRSLAENDADAERRAREYVDSDLKIGVWSHRITRMLKSRPAQRARASTILAELGGVRKTAKQLEQDLAVLQASLEKQTKMAEASVQDAVYEARQRVARAEIARKALRRKLQSSDEAVIKLRARVAQLESCLSSSGGDQSYVSTLPRADVLNLSDAMCSSK
jgi:serine/threonine protein kinase